VLTTEDEAQALARSEGPGGHNVGEDAALVAVEMAMHVRRFRPVPTPAAGSVASAPSSAAGFDPC
jgi:hypothetical protein